MVLLGVVLHPAAHPREARRGPGSYRTQLMSLPLSQFQIIREEADIPPDEPGGDGSAFFALRSCHQLLDGDRGEFFSPDYLCSNPPLWCNWTIHVDPGKRIHLHMEDFTPDDTCQLKRDQIHVDEPAGPPGGHRVLQRCWQEAKYTSSSNVLYVVLLIGGWPSPPYRGFYGRYQAFGPLVVYNPQDRLAERNGKPSAGLVNFSQTGRVIKGLEVDLKNNDDLDLDLDEEAADTEVLENFGPVYPPGPTAPAPTQTFWSGRGDAHTSQNHSVFSAASPQQKRDTQNHEVQPDIHSPTPRKMNLFNDPEEDEVPEPVTNAQSWKGEKSADGSEPAPHHHNTTEIREPSDENLSTYPDPEPEPEPEQAHPYPNVVELLSDHRENADGGNRSMNPHLPGDFLFEVAVEVAFSPDLDDSWDNQARSLLLSVKSLIREELEAAHPLLSASSKRIKRLNAGVLYILWLQVGQRPGGPQVHSSVHSALQSLIATSVGIRETHRKAVIMSVSTTDVNECGTQLMLCDANADCVNHFGSYSCRCRPGFRDESRMGSGGTVCVDMKGCGSGLSPETKGVYVLFFLLSSFILMLLLVAGVLYRRHHRRAFMVRCHSNSSVSPPDPNNNHSYPHRRDNHDEYSFPGEPDLPPPLPPARGPRGAWPQGKDRCPAVDLPLLRFSSLLPPDGYVEESGKM